MGLDRWLELESMARHGWFVGEHCRLCLCWVCGCVGSESVGSTLAEPCCLSAGVCSSQGVGSELGPMQRLQPATSGTATTKALAAAVIGEGGAHTIWSPVMNGPLVKAWCRTCAHTLRVASKCAYCGLRAAAHCYAVSPRSG